MNDDRKVAGSGGRIAKSPSSLPPEPKIDLPRDSSHTKPIGLLEDRELRFALIALGIMVLAIVSLFLIARDPFGWILGSPPVREAKKWLILCTVYMLVPALAGAWLLVVRPLRTGTVKSNSENFLRSQNPVQFRQAILQHSFLVAMVLALAVWGVFKFWSDLQKAQHEFSKPDSALQGQKQDAGPRLSR